MASSKSTRTCSWAVQGGRQLPASTARSPEGILQPVPGLGEPGWSPERWRGAVLCANPSCGIKGSGRDVLNAQPASPPLSLQRFGESLPGSKALMRGHFSPSDLPLSLFRWRMGLMVQARQKERGKFAQDNLIDLNETGRALCCKHQCLFCEFNAFSGWV